LRFITPCPTACAMASVKESFRRPSWTQLLSTKWSSLLWPVTAVKRNGWMSVRGWGLIWRQWMKHRWPLASCRNGSNTLKVGVGIRIWVSARRTLTRCESCSGKII